MDNKIFRKYPILYVDDETDNLDVFKFNFKKTFKILQASSGIKGLEIIADKNIAVIITDQRMPNMTGLDFLARAAKIRPDTVNIILTAYRDTQVLIDAISMGKVYRFITKPWNSEELETAIKQAIELFHLRRENDSLNLRIKEYARYLDREEHRKFDYGNIIGTSSQMEKVLNKINKVALTSSTVLIRGETGTGKELVAHAIHMNSSRSEKPFVKVNCAALSRGTLESELFGHEKGSFTGALSRRLGRFELADGGSLFLDEIGDLPMEIQVKLLRILQEREFERVGGEETISSDVRVISATHKDLEMLVRKGKFRHDLYYRLNVFPMFIPPLRERIEDIKPLISYFVDRYSQTTDKKIDSVDSDFIDALYKYSLPGNVRELENLIERAIILSSNNRLKLSDLEFGPVMGNDLTPEPEIHYSSSPRNLNTHIANEEKRNIINAIETTGGNMAAASRLLNINRSTLYYKLKKYELEHIIPGRE
jgi:two-component system, NtrC family, response regulator AtoC